MLTENFAREFAAEWVQAWNSHDLDTILQHYSEDFTIETPMALKLIPESNGVVKGKEAIRRYWSIGLERIPDLEFKLIEVLVGHEGLSIYYTNTATGKRTIEMMFFNGEGKVNKAIAHYSID